MAEAGALSAGAYAAADPQSWLPSLSERYGPDEQRVIDIPASAIVIQNLPEPPEGMSVTHVDVVVRVRKHAGN